MIEVTTNEPMVIEVRHIMHKHFEIEVKIDNQPHDLSISIISEEDEEGEDTELVRIRVDDRTFTVGEKEDVAEKLNGHLGVWFDSKYPLYQVEKTKETLDDVFDTIWEYLEEKDLC
jgi:hypothetical protein